MPITAGETAVVDGLPALAGEAAVEPAAPLTWSQRRALLCLCAGSLVAACANLAQSPLFPREAALRGLSMAASGAVFTCFALTQLAAFPLMGWLAPRLGVARLYRLGLALASAFAVANGLLGRVRSPGAFLGAALATRAAEAVGAAAMLTAARTLVASQFRGRLNTALSAVETMTGAGNCLGPAIGGALYEIGGFELPFFVFAALFLLMAVASGFLVGETSEEEPEKPASFKSETKKPENCRLAVALASSFDIWLCALVLLLIGMDWTATDPNMEPYVRRHLHMRPAELGLFFLGSYGLYTVACPVWGRVSDAMSNTFLLVAAGLLLSSLGLLLIPPSPLLGLPPSRALLAAGMVLREVFLLGAYLPLLGLMVRCAVAQGLEHDVRTVALVTAVHGVAYSLGCVVGPVGGGVVTDRFGYPVLATCAGVATVAASLPMAVRGVLFAVGIKAHKK